MEDDFLKKISYSNLELLKLIALFFMVLDHTNHYLYGYKYPIMFNLGRISFPIFAFCFSIALAKRDSNNLNKIIIRLVLFSLISSIPYFLLNIKWYPYGLPVNILFMFALSAIAINYKNNLEIIIFVGLLSFLVEYDIRGFFLIIGLYFLLYEKDTIKKLISIGVFLFGLCGIQIINGNIYSLFSIPLIWIVVKLDLKIIRIKHFFYYVYPIHLLIILFIVLIKIK